MPYNGSGTFSVYTPGTPYVTGTTISSTVANNVNTDFATGLSTALTKDGQTTATQRIPFAQGASMGSQTITAVADGTAVTHAATVGQLQSGAATALGSVAGTDTITASATPALAAYAAGKLFTFIPANTNTGATTININSVGARNIFWSGAACVGGEIRQSIPVTIFDDGTQFNIVGNGFNAPFVDTQAVVEGGTDRTKKVAIEVDGLTTATTRTITMPDANVDLQYSRAASDTAAGALEIAVQSEMETATSTILAVTPGRQQYHPSASKAWAQVTVAAGSPTLGVNYNCASVTDNDVGDWSVNFTTSFSSVNFVALAVVLNAAPSSAGVSLEAKATGSIRLQASNRATSAATDGVGGVDVVCFGDQ